MRSHDSEVLFSVLKGLNTPRALGLYLRYKYDGFPSMLKAKMHPNDYADAESFHKDYVAFSFFKKLKSFRTDEARHTAIANFTRGESMCRSTNDFLRSLSAGSCNSINRTLEASIFRMRGFISRVLGSSVVPALRNCKWTTGANVDLKRSHVYPGKKLEVPISVTRSCKGFLLNEIAHDPHWFESQTGLLPCGPYSPLPSAFLKIVGGGRFDVVPKTSLTDRSIIVEPRGNSLLQKSVGSFMRRRLASVGIDLNDQSVNQRLAQKAFRHEHSTIDLEMASDTISDELVKLLLPLDWYHLLNDLRSKEIYFEDSYLRLEKFSSMGNGFTFELESLIFAAAAFAVCDNNLSNGMSFSVYGDDIIVHRRDARSLIELLSCLGFTVNSEKTFLEGQFFESCGRHFYGDYDVTPIYQKEILDDEEAIRSYNRVYRLCRRGSYLAPLLLPYQQALLRLFSLLGKTEQPDFVETDDARLVPAGLLRFDRNKGYRGTRIRRLFQETPGHEPSMYAYSLRQSISGEMATYGNVRKQRKGYVLTAFYVNKFG